MKQGYLLENLYNTMGIAISIIAVLTLLFGALVCFAGYKVRKGAIACCGFILGILIGVGIGIGTHTVWGGVVVAVIMGIVLAIAAYKIYVVGLFLFVGSMSTAVVLLLCRHSYITVVLSVIIGISMGIVALLFVRSTIITVTALFGATVVLFSTCMIMHLTPLDHLVTSVLLWMGLSLGGIICQFKTTSPRAMDKVMLFRSQDASKQSFSEMKYPGMQRAYRNFCIKCGHEIIGNRKKCPICGERIEK